MKRHRGGWFATSLAVALAAGSFPRSAEAEESDGVYGRFDGDVTLGLRAGAAFASGGPAFDASLSGVYLATAGVYVHYTDALGSDAPAVGRSISGGVHLAPLFLIRGAFDGEHGPAFFDLALDSLAFELGAVWSAPRRPPGARLTLDETPGLEIALGFDLPLVGRASGPMLGVRGALRWRPSDFAPGEPSTFLDRGAVLSVTLGWHQVLGVHLIDPGDRVER